MKLYYFIHLTGRDPGNTGVQRVVRNLGKALQSIDEIELIPVRWCHEQSCVVHVENPFIETIARYSGPIFETQTHGGKPIHCDGMGGNGWLLIPEVPHLSNHDPLYPPVGLPHILGYANQHGIRCAAIFHDLLPLTHPEATPSDELEKLRFTVYGQALQAIDLIIAVSQVTSEYLATWWQNCGYRSSPTLTFVPLPEEMVGIPRRSPVVRFVGDQDGPVRFLSFGTVCTRKNQISVLRAFNQLRRRRRDLSMEFYLLGHVDPAVAWTLSRQVAGSDGSIKMLGYVSDEVLSRLIERTRATVFLSLAEGYGLPVAESLWLGKPCLCSRTGAVGEIAKAGGCITADPTNLDDIERCLERLCDDTNLAQDLNESLRNRRLGTWVDYARQVFGAIERHR